MLHVDGWIRFVAVHLNVAKVSPVCLTHGTLVLRVAEELEPVAVLDIASNSVSLINYRGSKRNGMLSQIAISPLPICDTCLVLIRGNRWNQIEHFHHVVIVVGLPVGLHLLHLVESQVEVGPQFPFPSHLCLLR